MRSLFCLSLLMLSAVVSVTAPAVASEPAVAQEAPSARSLPLLKPELVNESRLSPDVRDNIRAYLEGFSASELVNTQADRARVEKAVLTAMRALGYYRPVIRMTLGEERGRHLPLLIDITPDQPVRLAGIQVTVTGEAEDDPAFTRLLGTLPPVGSRLNHGDYDRFKSSLSTLAAQNGYFDAEFLQSELGVALSHHEAFWNIDFASGARYHFGPVTFSGSQIDEDFLFNVVPFRTGDAFEADKLADFSRRLSNTGWFDSVLVAPDFETAAEDPAHQLPLKTTVTPRKSNIIEMGIGYATDIGPRSKITWKKPWVNQLGHQLTLSTELSRNEPTLDTSYRIPLRRNPLEEYWIIQGGYKHTDLNDTEADTASFTLSRWWEFQSGWQRSVRLKASYDQFTQGDESHSTMLVYPGITFSRLRSRGGPMPYWADSQRYSVDFASRGLGSDTSFLILQAQQSWIRTYHQKHRVLVRGQAGWIDTDAFEQVPPDLRFFAGGDRSIRGYKYKSVSPRNADGSLTGASSLLTASLEYQYNISGKWWTALFYDIGEAVDHFKETDWKEGAGAGIRWLSPIGPVKFDIAFPINDRSVDDFQFLIGLGAEL